MNRDSIHQRIDELLGLLSIHNSRLSLHTQKLSQLDIDVLRKQCIDLYDEVNKLALQGKIKAKTSKPHQVVEPAAATKPVEPIVEAVAEPVAEIPKVEKQTVPKPDTKKTKVDTPKPKAKVDEEMQSLFEKFSSTPIESIAKGMSVAKRFEFQSVFFDGDHKEYNTFISLLENAGTREAAFEVYHDYKNKNEWENEELKDELKALMYRRYAHL